MVTKVSTHRPNPTLDRHIEENRAEVARFRAEHGDPAEALDAFIRATFNREALIETYEEYLNGYRGSPEPDDDPGSDG